MFIGQTKKMNTLHKYSQAIEDWEHFIITQDQINCHFNKDYYITTGADLIKRNHSHQHNEFINEATESC